MVRSRDWAVPLDAETGGDRRVLAEEGHFIGRHMRRALGRRDV